MKRLFTLIFILAIAVWAGISIAADPGYMLLAYQHWTLETPLWFGIILWLLVAFAIILMSNMWNKIINLKNQWLAWRNHRKLTRSNNLTIRSVLETLEGHFVSAEKNLLKALPNAELPFINYLIAAYCADELDNPVARDNYLLNAKQLIPEAEIGIQLLKIEWLLQKNNLNQAQKEVEFLLNEDPHQKKALLLAQKIYIQLGAWEELIKITQILKKRKIIMPEDYQALQIKAYAGKLLLSAKTHNINLLNTCWLTLPGQYQTQPELALVYAKTLIELEQPIPAEEILRHSLKKYWNNELIYWYGFAITPNPDAQIKYAEKCLAEHENDPVLLITLGRLCKVANLIQKARQYFEASITVHPTIDAYQALGEIHQNEGNMSLAAECFARALALSLKNKESFS